MQLYQWRYVDGCKNSTVIVTHDHAFSCNAPSGCVYVFLVSLVESSYFSRLTSSNVYKTQFMGHFGSARLHSCLTLHVPARLVGSPWVCELRLLSWPLPRAGGSEAPTPDPSPCFHAHLTESHLTQMLLLPLASRSLASLLLLQHETYQTGSKQVFSIHTWKGWRIISHDGKY